MLTVSIEELPSYALGRERGLEQGELTHARATLIRLLELRFGSLDDVSRARIASADLGQLSEWTDRVLTKDGIDGILR